MKTRIQLQLHAIGKKCNVKVFLLVVVHSLGTNCVYVFFFATCVIYLYRENRCRHSMSNLDIRSQIGDETNISHLIHRNWVLLGFILTTSRHSFNSFFNARINDICNLSVAWRISTQKFFFHFVLRFELKRHFSSVNDKKSRFHW